MLFNILSSDPRLQLIITSSLLVNILLSPLLCYLVIFLLQIYLPEIGCEHLKKELCLLSIYLQCLVQCLGHRSHLLFFKWNWILSYVLLTSGK